MKTKNLNVEYSFCKWYPLFQKNALEAVILPLPEEVCKYLEHDAFLLPLEATNNGVTCNSEWSDGSAVTDEPDEDSEEQPTFLDFSRQIQEVIDDFGSVFIKSNWNNPSDATWMASTKTLKCNSLEDIYLLLKSSDRISQDLDTVKSINLNENLLKPCLVLKRWQDIDPCTEFRCLVKNKELIGISQRDISQYYRHIDNEKYDIQRDITSLFTEKIKDKFALDNYSFDVIRYKKDKVKIVDFGPLNESVIKSTLFTYEEFNDDIIKTVEFRFIAEDMGIQPKKAEHFCIPQEINEFFQATAGSSMMDEIRKVVDEQGKEGSTDNNEAKG